MDEGNAQNGKRKYIAFTLGIEEFGIDIDKVVIIEQMKAITRVPQTPAYITGILNLRGDIRPIINLRKKFGLQDAEDTEDTRIIFVRVDENVVGVVVDKVTEVVPIDSEMVEGVGFNSTISPEYISGVGHLGGRIITLLLVETILRIN
ncbi:MAG: chemotaxis protein CheW [Oscillospiraceae bacterium]|nr:chemotaxis protein CheW [Oscillospiraceae bacterium]